jgi:hypothetical protein
MIKRGRVFFASTAIELFTLILKIQDKNNNLMIKIVNNKLTMTADLMKMRIYVEN